jgi:hypothetical protein
VNKVSSTMHSIEEGSSNTPELVLLLSFQNSLLENAVFTF